MRKILENFIVESDIELNYFDEVVDYIINNEQRILEFFKLDKLPQKVKIIITSYGPFKEFIQNKYGEVLNYVAGDSDSFTHTIRILNIDDQIKYTTHREADVNKIKVTALHEIVHQCHGTYHNDYRYTTWFAEGLATNLANQNYKVINISKCDFNQLKSDFRHYKGNYEYAYSIVNYVLNNYSDEEIFKLYSDPNYLREKAELIFTEAITWINKKLSNKTL